MIAKAADQSEGSGAFWQTVGRGLAQSFDEIGHIFNEPEKVRLPTVALLIHVERPVDFDLQCVPVCTWAPIRAGREPTGIGRVDRDDEPAVEEETARGLDDPSSARARAFVDRWDALIHEFTQGNREIAEGLARTWSDRANWTAPMKELSEPFADPRIWEFIRKVRDQGAWTTDRRSQLSCPNSATPKDAGP